MLSHDTLAAAVTPTIKLTSFVLAGRANFTIKSQATGKHYTYKVNRAKHGDIYHVSVLAADGYVYVGYVINGQFNPTTKPHIAQDDVRIKAFRFFWKKANAGALPEKLSFFHTNQCCKCARTLTDPDSIALGIGPECRKHGDWGI